MKKSFIILLTVVLFIMIFLFFSFSLVQVKGSSSLAYKNNSYCLLNKLAYLFSSPQRSDLVAYKDPQLGINKISRIIGLSGETISFNNDKTFVNGQSLSEPYLSGESHLSWNSDLEGYRVSVPDSSFLMLTDASRSRYLAEKNMINRSMIVGRIEFCR